MEGMDVSEERPPARAKQYKRYLAPHADAHINVGPEYQAAIPALEPSVALIPPTPPRLSEQGTAEAAAAASSEMDE
ncbi:unnamed protein product [Ectocarpus sp. CCAP 1310/34]|nr:unnamed protein product [Ectocarpus sp. CCAP 1310/34]